MYSYILLWFPVFETCLDRLPLLHSYNRIYPGFLLVLLWLYFFTFKPFTHLEFMLVFSERYGYNFLSPRQHMLPGATVRLIKKPIFPPTDSRQHLLPTLSVCRHLGQFLVFSLVLLLMHHHQPGHYCFDNCDFAI